jgi:L-malate glycosyltransferase
VKKHILYILPYLEQGGTEKQALSLIEHFKKDARISLLAPCGKSLDRFKSQNINYHHFSRFDRNLFKGLVEFRAGIRAIAAFHPIDLIHVHAAHELIPLAKLFAQRSPILFTVHGYHGVESALGYRLAAWFSNWWADGAIAVCQAEKDILVRMGIASSKINLIYNGVDEPRLEYDLCQQLENQFQLHPKEQIIIGTAARLTEAKGLQYLIKAFAKLALQNSQLRLVIAGSGELEQKLKRLTEILEVENQVIFTGYINTLPELIELFHIFVLPSLQEACSLACVEAMAQGKAVVGTKVGGIPEQIVDGETGFTVAAKDVDGLADRLLCLIENRELVKQFGDRGYVRYRQNFATAAMLGKTATLYDRLLNQPARDWFRRMG